MKKLIYSLSLVSIFLLLNCNEAEEEAAPVSQRQTVTDDDLWQLLDSQELQPQDFSRSKSAHSFAPVLDPINDAVVGKSLLLRTEKGLTMAMKTELVPKHTSTIWFVVFNNPENCQFCPCGGPLFEDFANGEQTGVAMIHATGSVNSANGMTSFAGHLLEGATDGSANGIVLGQPDRALIDSRNAEVFLVVRSHGPAIRGEIQDQIGIWEGGCTDFFNPFEKIPEFIGECCDIQVSPHLLRDCP